VNTTDVPWRPSDELLHAMKAILEDGEKVGMLTLDVQDEEDWKNSIYL
jgi:hypothetical protein